MNHIRHYPPDREFRAGQVDVDGGQFIGLRDQPDLIECPLQAADQHFSVQGRNDHFAVGSFHRAVDDNDIAVEDTCAGHGVAIHPHEEGRGLIAHQLFIQVDTLLFISCAQELFNFHENIFEGNGISPEFRGRENNLFVLIYLVNLC